MVALLQARRLTCICVRASGGEGAAGVVRPWARACLYLNGNNIMTQTLYWSLTQLDHTSYYKLGNVCVCVCVSVCLSGYTFPQFSTDLLHIWREPSTGHDTFRGLYIFCVHARARMCAFAYF
jgi:hypothetical protein